MLENQNILFPFTKIWLYVTYITSYLYKYINCEIHSWVLPMQYSLILQSIIHNQFSMKSVQFFYVFGDLILTGHNVTHLFNDQILPSQSAFMSEFLSWIFSSYFHHSVIATKVLFWHSKVRAKQRILMF